MIRAARRTITPVAGPLVRIRRGAGGEEEGEREGDRGRERRVCRDEVSVCRAVSGVVRRGWWIWRALGIVTIV